MAFITPKHEFDAVRRAIKEQFAPDEQDEIYRLLEPFLADSGKRIPLCILKLAAGRKADVALLVDEARRDYRNVIFWAENRGESVLDTPEKIDDLQKLLEWAGQPRSAELDIERQQLITEHNRKSIRPASDV